MICEACNGIDARQIVSMPAPSAVRVLSPLIVFEKSADWIGKCQRAGVSDGADHRPLPASIASRTRRRKSPFPPSRFRPRRAPQRRDPTWPCHVAELLATTPLMALAPALLPLSASTVSRPAPPAITAAKVEQLRIVPLSC